jgi:outer membrane protein
VNRIDDACRMAVVQQSRTIVGLSPANLCLAMVLVSSAIAQSAPVSWNHPWHSSEERRFVRDVTTEHIHELPDDPVKMYSLAELIDMAESNNPETRVAWESARAQAAGFAVARGELYPTLSAAALSQTSRDGAFFGNRFNAQAVQDFELALDLSYTVFDFGARRGRINAAKAQLLAANFAFNDTHRNVIYQVEQSYYRLLSSMGQEDAARASLSNAETVQEAAEDRLAHGLATLPDVLEARSATAQAEYDLQSVLGAEQIAQGDLATAVGDRASLTIKVQPLDQLAIPNSISDTVQGAIDRALSQRPDLMQQVAEIRSTNARVQEARSAYYPTLSLNAGPAAQSVYGLQSPYDWSHTAGLTGGLSFVSRGRSLMEAHGKTGSYKRVLTFMRLKHKPR